MLGLVDRYGWNATAFQTLEAGYSYFFDGDEACVAYVDTGRAWVAAGAPIAAHDRIGEVATAFMRSAREAGRRCCLFATEDRFLQTGSHAWRSTLIGEQPVWDSARVANDARWTRQPARATAPRPRKGRSRAHGDD